MLNYLLRAYVVLCKLSLLSLTDTTRPTYVFLQQCTILDSGYTTRVCSTKKVKMGEQDYGMLASSSSSSFSASSRFVRIHTNVREKFGLACSCRYSMACVLSTTCSLYDKHESSPLYKKEKEELKVILI